MGPKTPVGALRFMGRVQYHLNQMPRTEAWYGAVAIVQVAIWEIWDRGFAGGNRGLRRPYGKGAVAAEEEWRKLRAQRKGESN